MATLVIDATGGRCAASLVLNGAVVAERIEEMARGHAERLFPVIDAMLADAPASVAVDEIVVCTGPGSFTGARIGVAAARGLALGLGVRAVGVSWFEAIAAEAGGGATVALPLPRGAMATQRFRGGAPLGPPEIVDDVVAGDALLGLDAIAGREALALVAAAALKTDAGRPAPLYLRPPDALPPRDGPVPLLS